MLAGLADEEIERLSQSACERLCRTAEFDKAKVVMLFLPLGKEINTGFAVERAFEQGKVVVVPKVLWADREMAAVRMVSIDCEMRAGRYGLREPVSGGNVPIDQIDLVVVPGLGFDAHGNRLGRGGGFYDRFLSNSDCRAVLCGLGFERQVIDELPTKKFDVKMDMLATDQQVRRFWGSR